jgi:hypothetical protein
VGDGGPEEDQKIFMGNEKKIHYLRVKRGKNFRVSIRKGIGLYVV